MAMQDFSNKKALDRVVRDLEKIGHVSLPVRIRLASSDRSHILDHCVTRHGHLVAGRTPDASHGRYSWKDVCHSGRR